jgi:RimJ/RimL family protein N-acetyltransferase
MPRSPIAQELSARTLPDGRTVLISHIAENDAPALLEYVEVTSAETEFLTFGPREFGVSAEQEAAFIQTLDDTSKGAMLMAVLEGEMVGLATLARSKRSRIQHVGDLGVSVRRPLWHQGIGTSLALAALTIGKNTGVTRGSLQVRDDNLRAIRLAQHLGFQHEGRRVGVIVARGVEHDLLVMGKRL